MPINRDIQSRTAGTTWRRPLGELVGLVAGVALFSWLHDLVGTDVAAATTNAHTLQRLERWLNLDIEVAANHWLAQRWMLALVAVLYYRLYYVPLAGVLLWVLVWHVDVYRTVRRTLIVMAPLALLIYWLVPLSPPRFASPGIVDIVALHDPIAGAATRDLTNGQNHFSAMPSLHVGWSALCGYAAWLGVRKKRRGLALLVWLFPLGMVAVVIATGNHYVLDVAAGVALLTASIALAATWERCRRGHGPSAPTPHV